MTIQEQMYSRTIAELKEIIGTSIDEVVVVAAFEELQYRITRS